MIVVWQQVTEQIKRFLKFQVADEPVTCVTHSIICACHFCMIFPVKVAPGVGAKL